ncbi:serine hydrolase domain-containing protein [Paenibacillus filicis]|uniref:Serine hydrolase domain-containing protein n=1 Tax=Paenibacillus filicis TaxID=669464 RepID=A0ABU9DGD0_9BACL
MHLLAYNVTVKTRKKFLAALAAFSLISSMACPSMLSAASAKLSDTQEVEAFVDGFFQRPDIRSKLAGAVVVVVKGDQTLLNKGYGYANIERQTPVDPEKTLFRLASISKTFTATAVMQLAEQHQVDLDRDITGYLNGLDIPNPTKDPLTLKHLMTHTSGFDRTEAAEDEGAPGTISTLDAFVRSYVPTVIRKPGEAYRYDNYAYNLLGYIVQNRTGQSFDQVIADRIFKPLGMTHSYFALTPDIQEQLATPYDGEGQPLPQYATLPNNSPDGGLISTGGDMARFLKAQLNGGKLGQASILSEPSLLQMQNQRVHSTGYAGRRVRVRNYLPAVQQRADRD